MSNIDIRAEEEFNRLNGLLIDLNIDSKKLDVITPLVTNVAWMKVKLDDAREAVKNSNIAISYDNGGGQKGIRENPLFKGYEALWKSYMSGMTKIIDMLPEDTANAARNDMAHENKTILELVKNKCKEA